VYLPRDHTLVLKQASVASNSAEAAAKLKLVTQIMAGVHLAAAAEAMSLGMKVGLEPTKLFEIIATAAGTSWMFVNRTPQLLNGKWTSSKSVNDVVAELVNMTLFITPSLFYIFIDGLANISPERVNGRGESNEIPSASCWHRSTTFPACGYEGFWKRAGFGGV